MKISSVLQTVGASLIAIGAGLIFIPAGLILAGFFALAFGVALERSDVK